MHSTRPIERRLDIAPIWHVLGEDGLEIALAEGYILFYRICVDFFSKFWPQPN
jgi:hypothetical protein